MKQQVIFVPKGKVFYGGTLGGQPATRSSRTSVPTNVKVIKAQFSLILLANMALEITTAFMLAD
jgi:hypothetical protein